MSAFATHMMNKEMDKLDIPPIGEFIEMISDAGGQLYACKATVDMFHLKLDDFCPRWRRSSRSAISTRWPPAARSSSPDVRRSGFSALSRSMGRAIGRFRVAGFNRLPGRQQGDGVGRCPFASSRSDGPPGRDVHFQPDFPVGMNLRISDVEKWCPAVSAFSKQGNTSAQTSVRQRACDLPPRMTAPGFGGIP